MVSHLERKSHLPLRRRDDFFLVWKTVFRDVDPVNHSLDSPDPPVYCGFGFGFDFCLLFIVIRTPYIVFDSPPEADFGCATAAVIGVHAELNDAAAWLA